MKVKDEDVYLAWWRRATYRVSISAFLVYWRGGVKIVRGKPEISMKRDRDAPSELCGFRQSNTHLAHV